MMTVPRQIGEAMEDILFWLLMATHKVMGLVGNNFIIILAILFALVGVYYMTSEEKMGKTPKAFIYGSLAGVLYGALIVAAAFALSVALRWGFEKIFDMVFPMPEVSKHDEKPEEVDFGKLISEWLDSQ